MQRKIAMSLFLIFASLLGQVIKRVVLLIPEFRLSTIINMALKVREELIWQMSQFYFLEE